MYTVAMNNLEQQNKEHPTAGKVEKALTIESDPFSASLSMEQDTFDRSLSLLHELPSKDSSALSNYSSEKSDSSKSWKSSPKVSASPSVFPMWNKLTHLNRPLGTGTSNTSISESNPAVKSATASRRGSTSLAEEYDDLMTL